MLSRIAESMFWIGRYVERAEDTARLLQTHLRMLTEDTQAAEVDACRNLLALMSVDHVEEPRLTDLLRVLGYDPSRANVDLLRVRRGAGQCASGPRGDPARPLGVREHDLAPASDHAVRNDGRPRVPELGARAERHVRAASRAASWSATTAGSSCRWADPWNRST